VRRVLSRREIVFISTIFRRLIGGEYVDIQETYLEIHPCRRSIPKSLAARPRASASAEIPGLRAARATPPSPSRSRSFCFAHKISQAFYYELKRAGLGPEGNGAGAVGEIISSEAAADWRRARAADLCLTQKPGGPLTRAVGFVVSDHVPRSQRRRVVERN